MENHPPEQQTPRNDAPVVRTSLAGSALKGVWITLGALSLVLGIIGIVLPVLPTTPFVILAAFLFAKSSPALAERLNRNRTFGPIIADWRANGAIAPRYKLMATAMMAATFVLSVAMAVPTGVLVVQAICLTGAATYVLSRPS
ncbi:YbaN family protein [Sulfitobacter sp. F26169L]|uniref:YbaN family protein n=1 Tax=Sulfitobacter sp. F26169L TaxID=2996015 RepID=UPI0022608B82|nr:YbaN family protein [Sulfitobacter sp. F26169L]MCX7564980.1 YbaN family protein [Sulfitobacter sp. F26169L]